MIIASHDSMCLPFFSIFFSLHIDVVVSREIIGNSLWKFILHFYFIFSRKPNVNSWLRK